MWAIPSTTDFATLSACAGVIYAYVVDSRRHDRHCMGRSSERATIVSTASWIKWFYTKNRTEMSSKRPSRMNRGSTRSNTGKTFILIATIRPPSANQRSLYLSRFQTVQRPIRIDVDLENNLNPKPYFQRFHPMWQMTESIYNVNANPQLKVIKIQNV